MKVQFICTSSDIVNTVPVIDGQLIYLQDVSECFYDLGGERRSVAGLTVVDELPEEGVNNTLYLLHRQPTGVPDFYEEWVYVNDTWIMTGTSDASSFAKLHDGNVFDGDQIINGTRNDTFLRVQSITGNDGEGNDGALYLQFKSDNPIYLGKTASHSISSDGSKYSGTSEKAIRDNEGNIIHETYPKSTSLSDVAYSGSYTDLTNTPHKITDSEIDQLFNDW